MAQPHPHRPQQAQGKPALPQPPQPKIVLPAPSSAAPPALDAIAPAEPSPEPERQAQPEPRTQAAAYAMKSHGIMWLPAVGKTPGGYVFGEFLIEFDETLTPRLAEIELSHPTDRANACDRLRLETGKQLLSSGNWRK
jgi:hypothetical protein